MLVALPGMVSLGAAEYSEAWYVDFNSDLVPLNWCFCFTWVERYRRVKPSDGITLLKLVCFWCSVEKTS